MSDLPSLADRASLLRLSVRALQSEAQWRACERGEHILARELTDAAEDVNRWRRQLEAELDRQSRSRRAPISGRIDVDPGRRRPGDTGSEEAA